LAVGLKCGIRLEISLDEIDSNRKRVNQVEALGLAKTGVNIPDTTFPYS
jgi:hypothetical protein